MVYLKSIDAHGFKSFAEPTQIQFDQGVTAIVGPNGSGKSNITDAIKWVLGEQSARSLRGSKMEDIIFSGAKHRNAQNYAEVQLKLDNTKRQLNIDADEVVVTRRLYRSGESAYFLNNDQQRLKDITELFLDSGLGKEAFSIISQGRVDEVLNAKPIDRRQIIEESAGVLKYKKRKAASLDKLEQTEDNLMRVEDILVDLEARVEPLKEEAAIAKEYTALSDILQESDVSVTVHDIKGYRAQIAEHDVSLNRLKSDQERTQTKKHQMMRTIKTNKGERFDIDGQLERLNAQLIEVTEQVEKLTGQYHLIEERQKNQSQTNARIEEEQADLLTQRTSVIDELTEVKEQFASLKKQKQQLTQEVHELETTFETSQSISDEDVEQLKDRYYQLMTEQSDINNEIRFLTRTLEEHEKKQTRLDSRMSESYAKLDEAKEQLTRVESERQEKRRQLESVKSRSKETEVALTEVKQLHAESEEKLHQAYRYNDKLKSRIDSMKMREDDLSFFYQGVKAVLKATDTLTGIHGAVAQKIDVPSQYTTAIETALGASMQHVITTDEAAARKAIQYLKSKRLGRATFLPLSVIQPKQVDQYLVQKAQQHAGFIAVANQVVSTEQSYQHIVDYLLGRILIVDDLKHANEVAQSIGYKVRIVTLDGDVVNPGGSMTGGGAAQRQSLLRQKDEVQQLEVQLADYQQKTQQLERFCAEKKAEQTRHSDEYVKLQQQYNHLKQVLHDLDLEYDRYDEVVQRLQNDHEAFEFEKNDGYQSDKGKATLAAQERRKSEIAEQLATLDRQIKQLTTESKEGKAQLAECQQQLHQKQSDLAVLNERLRTQRQSETRLKQTLDQISDQEQKLEAQLSIINSDEVNDDTTLSKLETEIQTAQTQKETLMNEQDTLRTKRQSIEQLIEANEHALEETHQQLLMLENQYQEVKGAQSRLDVLIDHAMDHLSTRYHMTYEYAAKTYPIGDQDIEALRQKVKLTQMSIDELGPVNMNAVSQYEEVNERYTFLSAQRDDLREAKSTLEQLINEMDQEVVTRFSETFHAIQKHFSEVFQTLFGGGQAELLLTENDYLTAGVDIKVQPPGKKLQHLSLLSGGERALSAIALLFAILQVRSAPFVILDEVEAALDEANVMRYASYLKTLSEQTQFIVITHRKGTMEMCDRLYGVTMQELGVSKLVSVNLNTIDEVMKEEQQ
ncbi:chromosome segregation protein SMC [Staphylococcus muscae]|uniref:Chromosome partition protein Smc n=1 Tax=Staphylococcus muscae TaxID=1294 RepID=A0A240C2H5_9STAP|nr:chromosome segregation protein SMC [Staphylococcus muscae]AVQ32842.1 chromosome segregation protein SMC [Staphylococcus muscae]PNZ04192.1 chromosome segregation protein SMC [Staphylococcus muscae]GGA80770.1 chromosome partition protein Smc [Staphylococcus muscae]SNW01822.1 chromosome segregation protein SMC [Staphylococcus muscae]